MTTRSAQLAPVSGTDWPWLAVRRPDGPPFLPRLAIRSAARADSSWTATPRVATRKPAPGPRSIGPSRTFTLRTMERWGDATAPTTSPRSSPNCWRTRCGTRCRRRTRTRGPWRRGLSGSGSCTRGLRRLRRRGPEPAGPGSPAARLAGRVGPGADGRGLAQRSLGLLRGAGRAGQGRLGRLRGDGRAGADPRRRQITLTASPSRQACRSGSVIRGPRTEAHTPSLAAAAAVRSADGVP